MADNNPTTEQDTSAAADPLADMPFDELYTLVRETRLYLVPGGDYRSAAPKRNNKPVVPIDQWTDRAEPFRTEWQARPESMREAILARAFPPGPRQCYWVSGLDWDQDRTGLVPALVTENEPGYSLMSGQGEHAAPWVWGDTLDVAEEACQRANRERFYLDADEAREIVISSMNASRNR